MLTAHDWICIFAEISAAVESARDHLNELDGAIGDGDHGITMSVGYRAVREALAQLGDNPALDRVFIAAGQAFLSASGGAIGPLMGTMWADSGKALVGCDHFGPVECVRMLEAME
jgi:phosphoenolpyruvate---glycerone phosphotransferase subunit DhaL